MRFMNRLVGILFAVIATNGVGFAQQQDSIFLRKIYDEALSRGKAYEDLRSLCKDVGARLSGSSQAEMAVEWGKARLEAYGFDTVYLQEIKVPHWERGTKESAWIKSNKELIPVKILALGGSVSTQGTRKAELVVFKNLDALRAANKSQVAGKIVFINQPMDEKMINTFKAYGACYAIRGEGAIEAAKLGAVGVVIRSLGLPSDDHPHTGSMHYDEKVAKIPAAAISTEDANRIQKMVDQKLPIEFIFEMDCRNYPDATSYNVIAEITGSEKPNEIITFGGHLDSWDAGEGAHDDGAGIVHCMEALRILKVLNYKPKHTLRVVFFMNEENGNRGGMSYATWTKARGETQIAALESDRGGFVPRGFACDGSDQQVRFLQSLEKHFKPYELHVFEKGYGGVDIGPLKSEFPSIPLFGFVPDSQRYFDFHHAESDVFEAVNKRELELGCAAISSMIYLLDLYF
ncbi:MAG: peptidase M28 family protein [Crocinitomicaceae bacterium]|nr:MAG: peptidase M28 family protein [Crocinitomicaceae bacterium]